MALSLTKLRRQGSNGAMHRVPLAALACLTFSAPAFAITGDVPPAEGLGGAARS